MRSSKLSRVVLNVNQNGPRIQQIARITYAGGRHVAEWCCGLVLWMLAQQERFCRHALNSRSNCYFGAGRESCSRSPVAQDLFTHRGGKERLGTTVDPHRIELPLPNQSLRWHNG